MWVVWVWEWASTLVVMDWSCCCLPELEFVVEDNIPHHVRAVSWRWPCWPTTASCSKDGEKQLMNEHIFLPSFTAFWTIINKTKQCIQSRFIRNFLHNRVIIYCMKWIIQHLSWREWEYWMDACSWAHWSQLSNLQSLSLCHRQSSTNVRALTSSPLRTFPKALHQLTVAPVSYLPHCCFYGWKKSNIEYMNV